MRQPTSLRPWMRASLVAAVIALGCAQQTPSVPTQAAPAVAEAPSATVTLPDGFVVKVEIAADDELRQQGLMYRDQLRPATGMLFLFPQDGEYPFWMKNTRIPLDILWIDSARKIVHIEHDVPPCEVEDCPSYPPNAVARYVLELAGGVAKQHGLSAGQQLRFGGTEGITVR